jgi:hypothetical protein
VHLVVPPEIRPSDINREFASYVGKRVEVTGLLRFRMHGHSLFESKRLEDEFARGLETPGFDPRGFDRYCLTFVNWREATEIAKHLDDEEITVVGEVVTIETSHGVDPGSCALPTGIWIDVGNLRQRYPIRAESSEAESRSSTPADAGQGGYPCANRSTLDRRERPCTRWAEPEVSQPAIVFAL